MRSPVIWLVLLICGLSAPHAAAGPWVELPDAVAQLQVDPADARATEVLESAAVSITAEAARGNLPTVRALMEVYASLVSRLPDGDRRLERVAGQVARSLTSAGESVRGRNLDEAAAAWTLAASLDPSGRALGLLRELLVPPSGALEGQGWRSPLDGSELVFLAPSRVRVGCSEADRRCRDNEVYFRWVETPGVWIERTEVTNARYRLCADAGACSEPRDGGALRQSERDREPVSGVSWHQAREYARWVGRSLPSESVWERAARAADGSWRYPWGNARRPELANVWDDSVGAVNRVLPVASFPATGPGLYDLAGNVWEWCRDPYQPGLKQLPKDGTAVAEGFGRVVRGGSWRRGIDLATVSTRSWFPEDYAADDVGFRCVMPAAETILDREVLRTAAEHFPLAPTSGDDLARASVSAEDRRYLERRAITWLLLEERIGDAAVHAAGLLGREPRDPVALDVLERVPDELIAAARAGRIERTETLREALDLAASVSSRFARRRAGIGPRLVEAFAFCGRSAAASDRRLARACYQAGLEIAPDNGELRSGLTALIPRTGQVRISERDGRPMVWIPSGVYPVGASPGDRQAEPAEFPPSTFQVRGFWIDRDEVTNADYRQCVESGGCTEPADTTAFADPKLADHPVLHVSWFQAREYAAWSGKRLPTEVEWEVAARAGSDDRFPWGEQWQPGLANSIGAVEGDRWVDEAPVRSFPANIWGLHDMIGNASEWVEDVYHSSLAGMPRDGQAWLQETGPASERERVVRGGSYADPISKQRVSHRASRRPERPARDIGFRCADD